MKTTRSSTKNTTQHRGRLERHRLRRRRYCVALLTTILLVVSFQRNKFVTVLASQSSLAPSGSTLTTGKKNGLTQINSSSSSSSSGNDTNNNDNNNNNSTALQNDSSFNNSANDDDGDGDDLYHAFIVRQVLEQSSTSEEQSRVILKAIDRCRLKLRQDPQFFKAHQMLSVLLESIAVKTSSSSTSSINDDDLDEKLTSTFVNRLWMEVADSSWNAVQYSSSTYSDHLAANSKQQQHDQSLLDEKTRAECLVRSARALTMVNEMKTNHNYQNSYQSSLSSTSLSDRLVEVYRLVLPLLVDIKDVEAVLTQATTLFFSKTATASTTYDLLELATRLVEKFPSSIMVRQFQGAVFRKTGDSFSACQSYISSARLAHEQYFNDDKRSQNTESLEITIQSHILAASAIKETGSVVPIDDAFELLSSALSALKDFEELQDSNAALQGQDRNLLSSYIAKLYVEVYNTFGVMYKASGNSQDAIRSFERALSFNSNDGHALVQLASLDASPLPDDVDCTENASTTTAGTTSLDQDYIVDLFDGYSDRFEDELVSVLQYRGHEWVTNEVLEHIKRRLQKTSSDRTTDFDFDGTDDDQAIKFRCTVVDLGCGTGLVGQSLRSALDDPIFDKLDVELRGVDLSPRMVEITRSKEYKAFRTYDRVENNDAVKYLSRIIASCQSSVDYIVAADVFIYIGDLDELFEVAHQALCDNGVLIFSIEQLLARDDSRGVGLKLLRSGRFGHSQAYIETTANRHGLKLKLWKNGTLRKQRGEDVRGAVVVLEKE